MYTLSEENGEQLFRVYIRIDTNILLSETALDNIQNFVLFDQFVNLYIKLNNNYLIDKTIASQIINIVSIYTLF